MNTKIKFLLFFSFTFSLGLFSQETWKTAILRADAVTEINGVEAFCMRTTCGTEDFVLIKFVNKNNYKVRVEWKDAIYVNGEWFYSKNQSPKKLDLDPNNNIAGQCEGSEILKVKIISIIDNPKDFGHYTVSGLVTIK